MSTRGNVYHRSDLEELKKITEAKLLLKKLKEQVKGKKKNAWTFADTEWLVNNYANLSIEEIAKHLNKSVIAIKSRANVIGLKNQILYTDMINICELIMYFKSSLANYTWFGKLLEKHGCRIIKYKGFKAVREQEFLDWFKNHLHILDIKSEKMPFKVVPDWFQEKIQADLRAREYIIKRKWTKEEDTRLIEMIKLGYDYKTICMSLKRTGGALKRRMLDLKLDIRPQRVKQGCNKNNKWSNFEIEQVKSLYKKGYKPCIIQEYLPNKSELAINGLLERHNYFDEDRRFTK